MCNSNVIGETDNQSHSREIRRVKHPDLYFTDGTIVLMAGTMIFRVYYGQLCQESEVFRNMMEDAEHIPKDGETYDGCPLVQLTDDPEMLGYFLKALSGKIHLLDPDDLASDESIVAALGILRLSHKYMASRQRKKAIKWFESIIPQNSKEAIDMDSVGRLEPWKEFIQYRLLSTIRKPIPNIIGIFQECGLHRFLPWTLYMISVYGGTLCLPERLMKIEQDPFPFSNEAMLGLIQGRQHLEKLYRKNIWKIIQIRHGFCRDATCNEMCRLALLEHLTQTSNLMWLQPSRIPLQKVLKSNCNSVLFNSLEDTLLVERRLPCTLCGKLWLVESERLMQEAWVGLPKIFGLPSWEELKNEE
ncbi:hypothetical protein M422DRAFT_32749 [Sphaerobolus stellatus SS14]|uniref:Unplaced genomic scaffold SPHSTscaffold_78, whole genome shotgun sequence n=1 Tax=Sphaerobolus stellatus (strain SS14) TaxID=990650 RepID=A0A0C9U888_SPHS4|nr:hypothetical protein M422DRAFT_32749 [Sphaerobolus stellatus SS14]